MAPIVKLLKALGVYPGVPPRPKLDILERAARKKRMAEARRQRVALGLPRLARGRPALTADQRAERRRMGPKYRRNREERICQAIARLDEQMVHLTT
jgi:hypothetical protein